MIPYLLLLLCSAGLPALFCRREASGPSVDNGAGEARRHAWTFILFFAGLFLLLSLRHISVGTDLREYERMFTLCQSTSFRHLSELDWEVGYSIYSKLVSLISGNYRFFLIVTAAVTLLPIYVVYAREKRFSLLTVLLFINMPCFLMIFSGLRQAMAVSIGVLVYMALEKKRYVRGALLILLAASFHTSAVVLVLLYPAFIWKVKSRHLLGIIPAMVLIYLCREPILSFLIRHLPDRYEKFYGELEQTGAIGMLLLFMLFSLFSFLISDESVMTPKDHVLRNVLLLSTIFQLFVPIHGMVQRASYYFLIFAPLSLTAVVQIPRARWKQISSVAVMVMVCFFTVYFFYHGSFSSDNLLDVFPYRFLWSNAV